MSKMQYVTVIMSEKQYNKEATNILLDGIWDNNLEACRKAISEGADVNARVVQDMPMSSATLLHHAVQSDNLEMVQLLYENGAAQSINAQDLHRNTPLHHAAQSGNLEMVQFLYQNGAAQNINAQDKSGRMPLHYAAQSGNLEMVQFLYENGAAQNINAQDQHRKIPLHYAAHSGNLEMVQFLYKNGADQNINAQDKSGRMLLHYAAQSGNLEMVQFLCKLAPESINAQDESGRIPLHYAAASGNLEMVQFLYENGAAQNINAQDQSRKTPLHFAAESGNLETVQFLYKLAPESINAQDQWRKTPLHYTVRSSIKTSKFLIEHGATLSDIDKKIFKISITTIEGLEELKSSKNTTIKYMLEEEDFYNKTYDKIIERKADEIFDSMSRGRPYNEDKLTNLSEESQKAIVEKLNLICIQDGILSYEKADTALNSANLPDYIKEEMKKNLDDSRSALEVIEGGVLDFVYGQSPVPKDLLTKYQDNAHPYDPSTDKRKTLLDLKR
ncbi:MAG: ankyrin repeat domain-containing protein, partial [Rickettsiaceae bacterium]|nr:ankyrin repeat domain-containing protein [Rickettsiaceae bacterium]